MKRRRDDQPRIHMRDRISASIIIILVIFIFTSIAFYAYQYGTTKMWKERYDEAQQELIEARENLEYYKEEYEKLEEDIERYDKIYGRQRTELEFSRDIAILELSMENRKTGCLEETEIKISNGAESQELVISAEGTYTGEEPILHVFLDGKYENTLRITANREYRTRLGLQEDEHEISLVHPSQEGDKEIIITNISIGENPIEKDKTYFDQGDGIDAFDCEGNNTEWNINSNGALRFKIEKD